MAAANPPDAARAYVTVLPGNGDDDNVMGAVALAKSLKKVSSAHPLVVAISPDVREEGRKTLGDVGCQVREIEPVNLSENQTQLAMDYSKIRIWQFVEFSKMIYLHSDSLVIGNFDHLFELPDSFFHAVMDCFCEETSSGTTPHAYCQLSSDKPPPFKFSAGMFVFKPNLDVYNGLLSKITPHAPFADILNEYFRDIYMPIVPDYSLALSMLWRHPETFELERVKVIRFCAEGSQPWRYTGEKENMQREDIQMLIKKWWNIYEDASLDHKKCACVAAKAEAEPLDVEPFIEAISEADAAQDVRAPSAA